jgi:hypothetical protein
MLVLQALATEVQASTSAPAPALSSSALRALASLARAGKTQVQEGATHLPPDTAGLVLVLGPTRALEQPRQQGAGRF